MPRVPYEVHRAQKAAAREQERQRDYEARRRRGSLMESETDAESLFSSTTYQSHSSSPYFPDPRSYAYSHHSQYHPYHHPQSYLGAGASTRTLSSTSYGSSYPSSPNVNATQIRQRPRGRDRSASPAPHDAGRRGSSSSFQYQPFSASQNTQPCQSTTGPAQTLAQPDLNASAPPSGPSRTLDSFLAPPQLQYDLQRKERRERRRKEREERSTLVGEQYDSDLRKWIRWMGFKRSASWILPVGLMILALLKIVLYGITIMQWPSFRKGEIGPKRDAERSDDPAVVGNVVSLVAGEVIWTWAVIAYVAREGRKGGRSWRSQVTGILTILFSPLSLFMDNSQRIHLGLLVIALNLLNSSSDVLTLFALIMASVFEPSCAYTWPYIVGVFSGLLGKCLWLGGLRGSLYSLRLLLFGGVFLVIPAIVCTRTSFHEYIAEMRLIWPHFVGQSTLGNHIIQFLLNTASKYSAVDALHPGTYFDLVKQNKARTLLTTLASLPPLSILLYSNLSLRPSSRSTTGPSQISPRSPTVALIPLIIALLSIPAVVFSPTKENVILPLLPLTLMMGLRGSPSRSFEGTGGGTGEGSWLVGCAMNLLNSMLLVPLSTGAIQVTICNLFVAIWHHVIGAPRPPLAMLSIRQISAFIMPFLSNQRITNISFSEELYHRIAYALIWFWGMKKLIEDAWAMGGLSGSRSRSGSGGGGSGSGSGSGSSSKRSRESRDRGTPAGRREKNGAENGESDPVVVEQTEN